MNIEHGPKIGGEEKNTKQSEIGISVKKEEQPIVEEISPEAKKKAVETIYETLDIKPGENLNNFTDKLREATKTLPKYKEIEEKLKKTDKKNLPYELFRVLKKENDNKQIDKDAPRDGVLIRSMKQGILECAGRTLIASTFCREHGVDHAIVKAPGHSFVIIEQSSDTLAYFDANNDLYFTFPKSALEGYEGKDTISECHLKEFTPREEDSFDRTNEVHSYFITLPAEEGMSRMYLGNVAAALNGNKEFSTSDIKEDKNAMGAVHKIEDDLYGKNAVLEKFNKEVKSLSNTINKQVKMHRNDLTDLFEKHSDHNDFIDFFTLAINGNFGNTIPYVKNASSEQKNKYAEEIWTFLQQRNDKAA